MEERLTATQEDLRDKERRLTLVGERVREMEGRVAKEQAQRTEAEQRASEGGWREIARSRREGEREG